MKHTYPLMKPTYPLFLITVFLLFLISCEKDEPTTPEDVCENTNYTYTLDLKTLFDTNCATANCHNGSNSLADYSTYEGVYEDRYKLREGINQGLDEVTNGRAQLTPEEQDIVLCWIKAGAPE